MKETQKKEYYTWEEFDVDCRKIAEWAETKNCKNIYGIPRGGLVVAVKLSHLLDTPIVLTQEEISEETLIIDDIVDTGETVKRLLGDDRKNHYIASLYFEQNAIIKPNFFVREKTAWIVFPWETDETSKYDNTV
jgi:uncharacterized protein